MYKQVSSSWECSVRHIQLASCCRQQRVLPLAYHPSALPAALATFPVSPTSASRSTFNFSLCSTGHASPFLKAHASAGSSGIPLSGCAWEVFSDVQIVDKARDLAQLQTVDVAAWVGVLRAWQARLEVDQGVRSPGIPSLSLDLLEAAATGLGVQHGHNYGPLQASSNNTLQDKPPPGGDPRVLSLLSHILASLLPAVAASEDPEHLLLRYLDCVWLTHASLGVPLPSGASHVLTTLTRMGGGGSSSSGEGSEGLLDLSPDAAARALRAMAAFLAQGAQRDSATESGDGDGVGLEGTPQQQEVQLVLVVSTLVQRAASSPSMVAIPQQKVDTEEDQKQQQHPGLVRLQLVLEAMEVMHALLGPAVFAQASRVCTWAEEEARAACADAPLLADTLIRAARAFCAEPQSLAYEGAQGHGGAAWVVELAVAAAAAQQAVSRLSHAVCCMMGDGASVLSPGQLAALACALDACDFKPVAQRQAETLVHEAAGGSAQGQGMLAAVGAGTAVPVVAANSAASAGGGSGRQVNDSDEVGGSSSSGGGGGISVNDEGLAEDALFSCSGGDGDSGGSNCSRRESTEQGSGQAPLGNETPEGMNAHPSAHPHTGRTSAPTPPLLEFDGQPLFRALLLEGRLARCVDGEEVLAVLGPLAAVYLLPDESVLQALAERVVHVCAVLCQQHAAAFGGAAAEEGTAAAAECDAAAHEVCLALFVFSALGHMPGPGLVHAAKAALSPCMCALSPADLTHVVWAFARVDELGSAAARAAVPPASDGARSSSGGGSSGGSGSGGEGRSGLGMGSSSSSSEGSRSSDSDNRGDLGGAGGHPVGQRQEAEGGGVTGPSRHRPTKLSDIAVANTTNAAVRAAAQAQSPAPREDVSSSPSHDAAQATSPPPSSPSFPPVMQGASALALSLPQPPPPSASIDLTSPPLWLLQAHAATARLLLPSVPHLAPHQLSFLLASFERITAAAAMAALPPGRLAAQGPAFLSPAPTFASAAAAAADTAVTTAAAPTSELTTGPAGARAGAGAAAVVAAAAGPGLGGDRGWDRQSPSSWAPSPQLVDQMLEAFRALLASEGGAAAASNVDLTLMLASCARLGHVPSYAWTEDIIECSCLQRLDSFSSKELTTLAWSMASIRHQPSEELVAALCTAAWRALPSFTADNLATLVWSLAELGLESRGASWPGGEPSEPAAPAGSPPAPGQGLLHGGSGAASSSAAAAAAAEGTAPGAGAGGVRGGEATGEAGQGTARGNRSNGADAEGPSSEAASSRGARTSGTGGFAEDAGGQGLPVGAGGMGLPVAGRLGAGAGAGPDPGPGPSGDSNQPLQGGLGIDPVGLLLQAVCREAQPRLAEFAPRDLVSLLAALSRLGLPPPPEWLSAYLQAVERFVPFLDGEACATVLSSLVALNARVANSEWLHKLCHAVKPQLSSMDVPSLTTLAVGLARMGHVPDEDWGASFVAAAEQASLPRSGLSGQQQVELMCALAELPGLTPSRSQMLMLCGTLSLSEDPGQVLRDAGGPVAMLRLAVALSKLASRGSLEHLPPAAWLNTSFTQALRLSVRGVGLPGADAMARALAAMLSAQPDLRRRAPEIVNLLSHLREFFLYSGP